MTEQIASEASQALRPQRFTSHALVEIRRFRWLPVGTQSAVLLDISHEGFKIEFTSEFKAQIGKSYWITIPLAPLGIHSPTRLSCLSQCRWFDDSRFRVGGVFIDLEDSQRALIHKIVDNLRDDKST